MARSPGARRLRLGGRIRVFNRRGRRLLRAARATIRAALVRLASLSRRALRTAIILGVIGGVSLSVGAFAATMYGQFGYFPGRNADAWASRTPQFVGTGSCAGCHADQAATWAANRHAAISCESCHGPLVGHPDAATPATTFVPVPLIEIDEHSSVGLPESGPTAVCLTCHRATVGRPSGFPTVDPAAHFQATCTTCHDPHAVVAPRPPDVLHPLAGLPECTFCHSPTGLRPVTATHPTTTLACFACHAPSDRQP
jgi:hypothetical protein